MKWGTFYNFFLKSWSKCKEMVVCSKSCKVLAKSMIFCAFSRNEALLATLSLKIHRNTKTSKFIQKVAKIFQIDHFSCLFTARAAFCNFLLQCSSKRQNMVVFSASCKLTKSMIFRAFSRDDALSATFFLKVHQKEKDIVASSKSVKPLAKSMIFRAVSRKGALFATFSRKLDRNAKTW